MNTIISRTIVLSKSNSSNEGESNTDISISYNVEYFPASNRPILNLKSIQIKCIALDSMITDKAIIESAFVRQYVRYDVSKFNWADEYVKMEIKRKLELERLNDLKKHKINF